MTAYKKNIMVGVTMLVALALLAWMMWRFGSTPFELFAQPQMAVVFESPSAEGITEGSSVEYRGVLVGHVQSLRRSEDNRTVLINAKLYRKPPLPGNVVGVIRMQPISGTSRITLELVLPASGRPATAPQTLRADDLLAGAAKPVVQPEGGLRAGQMIPTRFVGYELLPQELTDLAADLRESSRELRRIMVQITDSRLVPSMAESIASLNQAIIRARDVLDSVGSLVADEKLRKDLSEILANFRIASESARNSTVSLEKTSANLDKRLDEVAGNANKLLSAGQARLDEISRSIGERLIQVAKVLDEFEAAARKVNDGKGTAGRFVNDPELFETLLGVSQELKETLKNFRRMIEQWEKEGVPIKLGK